MLTATLFPYVNS